MEFQQVYAKCAVRQRPAVMEGLPLSEEEYVVLAERALKIWYAAILAQPMKNYTPTAELDLVWHCHILDMHNYAGFLQQLGIKIGHVPFSVRKQTIWHSISLRAS
ncbi:unnamed protein product [Cladocopium goreaui]|uniref:Nitrilase n=1 Tax=Cladocopium goreaui TaxID=2562237 RepID=A0A9P1DGJ2_9DINO|nr:unnamed protein product [Cladocopium goreaui]